MATGKQADWYRTKVKENLGTKLDHNFRLWYTDSAIHGDQEKQEDPTHTVSYLGILEQALVDISAWVEKGVPPPPSTNYKVQDGQIAVPATAAERQGVQPVVTLRVNGGLRTEAGINKKVDFLAVIEMPSHTGKIIRAEWDFEGEGSFRDVQEIKTSNVDATGKVTLRTMHAFSKPGTYFPVLRATSQRDGDTSTPFARIENLGRVRVVVKQEGFSRPERGRRTICPESAEAPCVRGYRPRNSSPASSRTRLARARS